MDILVLNYTCTMKHESPWIGKSAVQGSESLQQVYKGTLNFFCLNIYASFFVLSSRERDELAGMLAKHKSLLEQCQQREFEAFMEVKKSAETAESANLEKAEVCEINEFCIIAEKCKTTQ